MSKRNTSSSSYTPVPRGEPVASPSSRKNDSLLDHKDSIKIIRDRARGDVIHTDKDTAATSHSNKEEQPAEEMAKLNPEDGTTETETIRMGEPPCLKWGTRISLSTWATVLYEGLSRFLRSILEGALEFSLCGREFKWSKKMVAAAVGGLLLSLVVVFILVYHFAPDNNQDDGFHRLEYPNRDGAKQSMRYNLVQGPEEKHNFAQSIEACHLLGAELWDIRGGESEWKAMTSHIKTNHSDELDYGIWLNGKSGEKDCRGPGDECRQKARDGQGVAIEWPSEHLSNFSRLPHTVIGMECIVFGSKDDLLWKNADCNKPTGWALCVKYE